MLFNKGDIVITNEFDLTGVPLKVIKISSQLRLCECEYEVCGIVYKQDFGFDELTVIMEG